MTNRRINRTTDARVADALGWRCGVWSGAWSEDAADTDDDQDVAVREDIGWLTPNGTLRRSLPPFAASEHYVPMLLRWLKPRADVVIRPRKDGVRVQAWWIDDTGRENGAGVEIDAPSMPQAVAETVVAYQEHLVEWATLPHGDEQDEDEDDIDG